MDIAKKAAFVSKMGKKRLKLTKRQNFASGGLAGMFGVAGGEGGTGFSTNAGTNAGQLNTAYNNSQTALGNQANLVNTLTPQAAQAVNAQNVLSGQYAAQAAGQGPNVAQNQLAQATGANVANQAALMAGQRGAGANPALMARQAAMQGAATQQGAAGQAATLGAEQQISAQQAQAQLAGNQIAQTQGATTANTQAQQGEQGILQGANTAQNNVQGGLANTTLQGQQGALGGLMKGASSMAGGLFAEGGEVHGHKKLDFVHKMAKMGLEHFQTGGPIMANAQEKQDSMRASFGTDPAAADVPPPIPVVSPSPAPSPAHVPAMSEKERMEAGRKYYRDTYGEEPGFADGGNIVVPQVAAYQMPQNPFMPVQNTPGGFTSGPNSGADALAHSMDNVGAKKKDASPLAGMEKMAVLAAHGGEMHPKFQGPHGSHIANFLMSKGGAVDAMVSPGEVSLTPEQVERVIHEDADPKQIGKLYGGKAKVKGDSEKNDTIPDTLQEGGVVVDREHMSTPEKRKLFVHKAIAKKRAKR